MKATNVTKHDGHVSNKDRERMLGQGGAVVWLTGLSGSGKSTVAYALERVLTTCGHLSYVLDGDNLRHGLNGDLGFGEMDRKENIRRAGEVAALFADAGVIAIAAFISPYRKDRDTARRAVPSFFEVFCDTPLETCEARDPKGLYAKARDGEISGFTGIDDPYEPPVAPEMVIDESLTPEAAADALYEMLGRAGRI